MTFSKRKLLRFGKIQSNRRNRHLSGNTRKNKWLCTLGPTSTTPSHEPKLKRRIRRGWITFRKQSSVLRGSLSLCLDRKILISVFSPVDDNDNSQSFKITMSPTHITETKRVTDWKISDVKRPKGRPFTKWCDGYSSLRSSYMETGN